MNCIPGDLAVIVRTEVRGVRLLPPELVGCVVQVDQLLSKQVADEPTWALKHNLNVEAQGYRSISNKDRSYLLVSPGDTMVFNGMFDCVLQPIRGVSVKKSAETFANL